MFISSILFQATGICTPNMMNRLTKQLKTNFQNVESVEAITSAASLAFHFYGQVFSFVKTLTMCDMDLSSIPTSHMEALALCAKCDITINNVTGFDLVSFLEKIPYGEQLNIDGQSLNDEEAQALMKILGRVDIVETSDETFLNLANRTAERLTESLSRSDNPSKEDIDTASFLADHGFIQSLEHLSLRNVNCHSYSFKRELFELILCVHGSLALRNINDVYRPPIIYEGISYGNPNSTLVQILELLSIKDLSISTQIMDSKSSEALVQRMATRVRTVKLCKEVTLDIKTFTKYDGMGKCSTVMCFQDTAERYKEDLMGWAQRINWDVDLQNNCILVHRSEG